MVDPVLQFQLSDQTGNPEQVYLNTKGLTFRGRIGDHVGFSSYITDNQERGPDYFTQGCLHPVILLFPAWVISNILKAH